MKLYSAPPSPFAARVRMSIYRKGLDQIEILAPPDGGTKGEAFLAINPIGQVPTLVLDDGFAIPESATILEYLEDVFPEPSLRPVDKRDLARARLFLRLPDLYFQGAPRIIIGIRRSGIDDEAAFTKAVGHLRTGLAYIDHYIDAAEWAVGGKASLADCALIPVLNVVAAVERVSGLTDLISSNAKIAHYWSAARLEPINAKVIGEQNVAFERMMAQPA